MPSEPHNRIKRRTAVLGGLDPGGSEIAAITHALRTELEAAAERPAYFWTRQHAHIRERIAARPVLLRWPILAMAVLAALSFALLSVRTPAPAPVPAIQAQAADADDLLLMDIQHSLSHRTPQALMPANVLVQEMISNSNREQKRDN